MKWLGQCYLHGFYYADVKYSSCPACEDIEVDRRLEVFREAAEIQAEMDKTRQGED